MKDVKIQNIQPTADPKAAGKANRKETAVAGQSFKETLTESLQSTVATMSNLNAEIQKDPAVKTTQADPSSMKEEIHAAKENFDQMMLQKQNLFQLYQRLTNKDDS